MTNLITAFCAAHRECLRSIAAGGDEKALSSTARKIEATLVPELKAQKEEVRAALGPVIMNSGSLKALKLVPANIQTPRWGYRSESPDAEFICAQPAAYMREAQKRGFTISPQMRMDLFTQLSEATSNHARMRPEAFLLQDPVDPWMMGHLITRIADMTPEVAARVAPASTKMLKAGLKAHAEETKAALATLFCIHDPAAAHEHLFRIIALYALMGVKPPVQAEIEHDDMRRLSKLLFGRDGRKDLTDRTGGLEAYLASGLTSAAPILAEFEQKRRFYTPPGRSRSRRF